MADRIEVDMIVEAIAKGFEQVESNLEGADAVAQQMARTQNELALALQRSQDAAYNLDVAMQELADNTDPSKQRDLETAVLEARVAMDQEGQKANELAVELQDLAQGTQEVEGANEQAGLSFTELNSVISLARQGVQAAKQAWDTIIQPTLDYANQVRELGRTIGSTAEESSKLIQAADDVGISAETVQSALEAAIRKGVKPTIEGLGELADKYNAIRDPIARTAFLMDTFGRSGADLAPLMEKGGAGIKELGDQAEATGLVMNETTVKAARTLEIAVDDLGDAAQGAALDFSKDLIPPLTDFFNTLSEGAREQRIMNEAVKQGVTNWFELQAMGLLVEAGLKKKSDMIDDLTRRIQEHIDAHQRAMPVIEGMGQAEDAAASDTNTYASATRNAAQWLKDLVPPLTDAEKALRAEAAAQKEQSASAVVAAGVSGTLAKIQDDYKAVLDETAPKIADLTAEIARYESLQGKTYTVTTDATASLAEYELAQIHAAEASQKLAEYTGDNREELLTLQVAAENAKEKVGKLGEQMGVSTTYTADYTTKLAEDREALAELKTKNEEAAAAMKLANDQFFFQQVTAGLDAAATLEVGRALGLIDEPTYTAAKAAQTLNQGFKDGAGDADALARATGTLRDTIASLQSKNIEITVSTIYKEFYENAGYRPQHEGDTGAGGEGGYGGGTGTGGASDDTTDHDHRASGGPVTAGQGYWVGETGPEMFVPGVNGRIVSHADSLAGMADSGGAGGIVFQTGAIVIQIPPGSNVDADLISQQLAAALRNQLGSRG